MKHINLFAIAIVLLVSTSVSSCKKCWHCKKQIEVDINGKPTKTDAYYEDEACGKKELNKLEDDGFNCIPKA
jgi:hypothetical protein